MDIKEIKKLAKERMNGLCNLCKECNGVYCAGQVPGMGGTGTGDSFKRNFEALKNVKLVLRTMHGAKNPDMSVEVLGEKLELPLICAPVTGSDINMGGYLSEQEYCDAVVFGSKKAGTIAMVGDSGKSEFYVAGLDSVKRAGGYGVAVIKPRENDEVIKRLEMAHEVGVKMVGMDIDGAGLVTMALFGQPVGPKSMEDIAAIKKATKLPFILKGIMSSDEAVLAAEAGVDAIVVSNHGGRILNHTLGAAEVLPSIARAVKGRVTILADGNVREGADILKYIALGADAVLAARPMIWGAVGGGEDGVKAVIDNFKSQLYQAMLLTGCNSVKDIDESRIVNLNAIK